MILNEELDEQRKELKRLIHIQLACLTYETITKENKIIIIGKIINQINELEILNRNLYIAEK